MKKIDFHTVDSEMTLPQFHSEEWQCYFCKNIYWLVSLRFCQIVKVSVYQKVFHVIKNYEY